MGILRERGSFCSAPSFLAGDLGDVPGQPGAKEGNLVCVIKCSVSYCPRPLTVAWFVVLKESVATPVPKKAQRYKILRQPPGVRLRSGAVLSARGSPLSTPQS